jgi:stage II sporulation protein GA (sporulation sigma-E factor processing peptidase)
VICRTISTHVPKTGQTGDILKAIKIYADLTFLINLIMDFLILWAAGKLSGANLVYSRILIGAAAGGIYAVGNLFPALAVLYNLPLKLGFSVLLIIFTLRPQGWQEFKKNCLYFYGLSIIAAGTAVAACYLYPGSSGNISYVWLPAGVIAVIALGYYGSEYLQRSIIPELLEYTVKIRFGEDECSGKGFLDTGNSLRDPVTNRPVVVAEYQFMEQLLPGDFKQVIDDINSEREGLDALAYTSWANRLRLIPFTSIGKKNGMLIGVRCDEIVVSLGKKFLQHSDVVIGLYRDSLCRDGQYQMLIPSEILR